MKGCLIFLFVVVIGGGLLLFSQQSAQPLGRGVYDAVTWSPDSTYLAFMFESHGPQLWLLNMETRGFSQIDTGNYYLDNYDGVVWQDDNTLWAVSLGIPENLLRIEIDTGQIDEISVVNSWHGFAFAPDDQHIVYSNESIIQGETRIELYSLDLQTMTTQMITDTTTIDETRPHYSPDGQYLAYMVQGGIQITNSVGETWIVEDTYMDMNSFAWSPDSQWFLSEGARAIGPGVFLSRVDGSEAPRLVYPNNVSSLAWSPDGQFVAYTRVGEPGSNELHIISADEWGLLGTP
jgi:Tol biopolymer transport system component